MHQKLQTVDDMKKLLLLPKTDTVTICLPMDWVGRPIICILKTHEPIVHSQGVQDQEMAYRVKHIKSRKSRLRKAKEEERKKKRLGRFY